VILISKNYKTLVNIRERLKRVLYSDKNLHFFIGGIFGISML